MSDALSNRAVMDEGHLFTISSCYMSIHSIITSVQFTSDKPEKGNKLRSQLIPSVLTVPHTVVSVLKELFHALNRVAKIYSEDRTWLGMLHMNINSSLLEVSLESKQSLGHTQSPIQ